VKAAVFGLCRGKEFVGEEEVWETER
jgi:hypothetical protein